MAASTSMMMQTSAALLGSKFQCGQLVGCASPSLSLMLRSRKAMIRCEAGDNGPAGGLREAVDRASKKTITRDDILRIQETNESEKKSVMGTEPSASGSFYPRPEVQRRPETGDLSFTSVFAFDGAAPEIINCRLAMVGMVWVFFAEKATGLTVFEQLYVHAGAGGAGVLRGRSAALQVHFPGAHREPRVHRRAQLRALHGASRAVEWAAGHAWLLGARPHRAVPPRSLLPLKGVSVINLYVTNMSS